MGPATDTRSKGPAWRKRLRAAAVMAVLLLTLFLLRYPLLRGLGDFLITEDPLGPADAVFVLGGSVQDRGTEAARVYASGVSQQFVFTGAPVPSALQALGLDSTEAECTRNAAVVAGLPTEHTLALNVGTSTYEEFEALLAYSIEQGFDTVIVVSSPFHLRRIGRVFRKPFRKAGITVLLHGAPSTTFHEETWWEAEDGLIMLNNEYVKLVYYWLRY